MVNFNPVSTLEHLQNINNAQNQKVIQSLYNSDVPRKHINDNNENTTPQIPITENIAQDGNNKSSASKMSNSDFDPSFSFETSNELNENSKSNDKLDIYISSQINYGNTNFPNNENSTEETYFKGINALINSEDFEGLVECLMEIIKRFENSSDRNSNKLYVEALFHKGLFLSKIEKYEDSIEAYDNFLNEFEVYVVKSNWTKRRTNKEMV